MHGYGIYQFSKHKQYSGYWKFGKQHGLGKYTYIHPQTKKIKVKFVVNENGQDIQSPKNFSYFDEPDKFSEQLVELKKKLE